MMTYRCSYPNTLTFKHPHNSKSTTQASLLSRHRPNSQDNDLMLYKLTSRPVSKDNKKMKIAPDASDKLEKFQDKLQDMFVEDEVSFVDDSEVGSPLKNCGPSQRPSMHDRDRPRAVTFYNFDPPKLLHYACQLMDTNPIQVAHDNRRGSLEWSLLKGTGGDQDDYLGRETSGQEASFQEVLSRSRAICIKGTEFRNEIFRECGGLEAVTSFYGRGGTVVMIGGNCHLLNQLFGCEWSYRGEYTIHDFECVATNAAARLLGAHRNGCPKYPSQVAVKEAMLIEVPPEEALYLPRPYENKRQFLEAEGMPLEEDWYNDETGEIDEVKFYEKKPKHHELLGKIMKRELLWNVYIPATATPIAVHVSAEEGGGSLVWVGDNCDQDTNMRSLLKTLLTTDFHAATEKEGPKPRYDAPKGKYRKPA